MADISIRKEDDGRHGRYVAHVAGIDADAALVDRLIADARAEGLRIIPLCPYVRARYVKHPDWQDVMTVAPGEKPAL